MIFQYENYIFEDKEFLGHPFSVLMFKRLFKYTSFAIFDMLSYICCSLSLFCFSNLFNNYNILETASANKNSELPKDISRM